MVIQELPFFAILLLTILPITIGIIIFARILGIARGLITKFKSKEVSTLMDFGELYLFVTFLVIIIGIVYYIMGSQPSGFSIFDFLIVEMLPIAWYSILLYGIIVQLVIMLGRGENIG